MRPIRRRARRISRRRLRREVRDFVLAGATPLPGAEVRNRELLPAVIAYLRAGRAFERHGLATALGAVPVPCGWRSELELDAATAFCARCAASRVLGIARTIAGRHLCLHESVAVTAALRRLGFRAEVVIGYPVIEATRGEEELHAWPQLGDYAVTERLGSAPMSFVELMRVPHGRGPAAAAPAGG